jgi:hypothetical protein
MTDTLKTTIIGSYKRSWDDIQQARRIFLRAGLDVLRPVSDVIIDNEGGDWVRVEGDPPEAHLMRERQLEAIRNSDFVYVVNPAGFIGTAGSVECGYALALQIPIYYSSPPFDPAAAPGTVARALGVLQSLSRDKLPPADLQLLEDYVRGEALHIGRRGSALSLQGADAAPVLAHHTAGPLARRMDDHIELRPNAHRDAIHYRMQLLGLAHKHHVRTREVTA